MDDRRSEPAETPSHSAEGYHRDADEISALLGDTTERQRRAADPEASVWVSANAGTGKTHVLTQRVLRLLLAGAKPETLLCLTYTKAAAAEMSRRVFDRLAHWVVAAPDELESDLARLNGRDPTGDELIEARKLFAVAIETPGGLKVQTIHAFCERLLQRFPIEAGIAPDFQVLDEAGQATLVRTAIDEVLGEISGAAQGSHGLADDLRTVITHAIDEQFDELLVKLVQARRRLTPFIVWATDTFGSDPEGHPELQPALRACLGVDPQHNAADSLATLAGLLSDEVLATLKVWLEGGGKQDNARAADCQAALMAETIPARVMAIKTLLLTAKGEPRSPKSFITKVLRAARPDLTDVLETAQDACATELVMQRAADIADSTAALLRIGHPVISRYEAAKRRDASADYDDLIACTAQFLSDPDRSAWALYKLDQGLDHILVDEAQDTSPEQWQVISSLAHEFIAGDGARDEVRTIFAVGDEKQSIYSFQGAVPEEFAAMGRYFAERVLATGARFERIPLTLSFRTVAPILQSVDMVFADPSVAPGLSADATPPKHDVKRLGQAGLVALWELEAHDDHEAGDAFDTSHVPSSTPPAQRVAERVADTVRHWLDTERYLASAGRPIRPSDILVLLRKRNPLAPVVIRALKARQIPVAGADRIRLTEQIGVMDLLALADFVLLPEDDLALANVLKSPLIGLDDESIFSFAHERRGSLWQALLAARATNATLSDAAEQLMAWRAQADFAPPYEFFSLVLDRDGGRKRLAKRLGPEATDAIDALLELAINFDESTSPSLQLFLHHVRTATPEIKRDMDDGVGEVRIMTVHGAKGLEAPIVFLPDCNVATAGRTSAIVPLDVNAAMPDGPPPTLWGISGASQNETVGGARLDAKRRAEAEANRLLYVAMTRARDELYIGGILGRKEKKAKGWYALIEAQLAPHMTASTDFAGRPVLLKSASQNPATEPDGDDDTVLLSETAAPLPDWTKTRAPRHDVRTIPVTPSRLVPLDNTDDVETRATHPAAASPLNLRRDEAIFRGHLAHVLLQMLPDVPKAKRATLADAFLAQRAAGADGGDNDAPARGLSLAARTALRDEVLRVLDDPELVDLFGPDALAEVPLVAELPDPEGRRAAISVNGTIDRLLVGKHEVLIVDFKTNRRAPRHVEDAPDTYILQLAAYRAALQAIYPNHQIHAALVWTAGPTLMPVPDVLIEQSTPRLWDTGKA